MGRLKTLLVAMIMVLPLGAWSAEVSDQIIGLYERITNLQERVHRLEESKAPADAATLDELRRKVDALQPGAQANVAADPALKKELADLSARIETLSATPGQAGNNVPLNHAWVIICGILVMSMQMGFAFVEAGLTRSKNAVHTLTMNLMDYGIGMMAFWAVGFALMFGGVGAIASLGIGPEWLNKSLSLTVDGHKYGFVGLKGFFLHGLWNTPVMTFFFFQMVFAATANTICSGTLAERWRIQAFSLSSVFVAGVIYPLYGSWVWGGGWLSSLGYLDFAGSSVVHLVGGIIAFAGAMAVGPRKGKFDERGRPHAIPGHNLAYVFLGTFVLAIGWFGFNAGSSLRAGADMGLVVVNTAMASAAGSILGLMVSAWKFGKPDPTFACNGMLAGLVGVTAGCAYVEPWAAVVIGSVSGTLVVYSALFIEEKLKIDDPVGAISVHGVNGAWGIVAVGLFAVPGLANRPGLVYGGLTQFLVQVAGVLACVVAVFVMARIMFFVIERVTSNRANDAEQEEGLDLSEMGVNAYNAE